MTLRAAAMWVSKGRADIARQLAQKALAQQTDSPDALALIADLDLREGKPEPARKILALLRQQNPKHPATLALAELLRVMVSDRDALTRMRLLVRGGKGLEAAALARTLFPQGPVALGGLDVEYYETIAGANPGEANRAAEALARMYRNTGETRYGLAEIGLRLRRSPADGLLPRIEQLAAAPDVNQRQVLDVWRRAINALDSSPRHAAALQAYLRVAPDDPALRERLAAMQLALERGDVAPTTATAPLSKSVIAAKPLRRAPTTEAELMRAASRLPGDAAVLGSLGRIRLKEGRYAEAQELFGRAALLAPRDAAWAPLRAAAEFDGLLRLADLALEGGNPTAAAAYLTQALALQPESPQALIALAGVRGLQRRNDEAEALYRQVLARESQSVDAVRGLAGLLARTGRAAEAIALLDATPTVDVTSKERLIAVRLEAMRAQADAMLAAGRIGPALRLLESAVAFDGRDPWLRHALARVYLRLQLPADARAVMDGGMALLPADADMHYARALIMEALDDYRGVLADLGAIEKSQTTDGMRALQRRARVQQLIVQTQTETPSRDSPQQSSAELLVTAETVADGDPDLAYAVANAWFRLGQSGQAVASFGRALARMSPPSSGALLDRARLVDRAADDALLAQLLPALWARTDWTQSQERLLLVLYTNHQERLINAARSAGNAGEARARALAAWPLDEGRLAGEGSAARGRLLLAAGDFSNAATALAAAVATLPDRADIRLDLANALAQAGRTSEARVETEVLARQIPASDVGRRLALVRLWQRTGDVQQARAEGRRLLASQPADADVVLHLARLERSDGHYVDAVSLFRRALDVNGNAPALRTAPAPIAFVDDEAPLMLQVAYLLDTAAIGSARAVEPDPGPFFEDAFAASPSLRIGAWAEAASGLPRGGLPPPNDDPRRKIEADIAAIESRRQAMVESGYQALRKKASDGISSLRGSELPFAVWWPGDLNYDGRYFLRLDRVRLDAGALPASAADAAQFGQVAASPPLAYRPADAPQSAQGYNVGVGYQGEHMRWDVGRVGNGFPVANLVGGWALSGDAQGYRYEGGVSRRALTGSLLSYAGTRDPATGGIWGGVVATGAGGRLSTEAGPYSIAFSANYALLTGRNVQDNTRLQTRLAIDRDVMRGPLGVLNMGVSLSAWQFERDLSQYTWGHGGYYSPHRYLSLALPLEWSGEHERFAWLVRGSLSASRSSSRETDYYPGHPTLQGQASALFAAAGGDLPVFAGGKSAGTGRSLRAVAEYRPAGRLALGAQLELDRSAFYAPTSLLFYVRFLLDPVSLPLTGRPRPVQPYSQF